MIRRSFIALSPSPHPSLAITTMWGMLGGRVCGVCRVDQIVDISVSYHHLSPLCILLRTTKSRRNTQRRENMETNQKPYDISRPGSTALLPSKVGMANVLANSCLKHIQLKK